MNSISVRGLFWAAKIDDSRKMLKQKTIDRFISTPSYDLLTNGVVSFTSRHNNPSQRWIGKDFCHVLE